MQATYMELPITQNTDVLVHNQNAVEKYTKILKANVCQDRILNPGELQFSDVCEIRVLLFFFPIIIVGNFITIQVKKPKKGD